MVRSQERQDRRSGSRPAGIPEGEGVRHPVSATVHPLPDGIPGFENELAREDPLQLDHSRTF